MGDSPPFWVPFVGFVIVVAALILLEDQLQRSTITRRSAALTAGGFIMYVSAASLLSASLTLFGAMHIADTSSSTESAATQGEPPVPGSLSTSNVRDCTLCPQLVVVPPGRFMMGSNDSVADANERPPREVAIGSFAIATHEVTLAEFAVFAAAEEYLVSAPCYSVDTKGDTTLELFEGIEWWSPGFPQDETHPVVWCELERCPGICAMVE